MTPPDGPEREPGAPAAATPDSPDTPASSASSDSTEPTDSTESGSERPAEDETAPDTAAEVTATDGEATPEAEAEADPVWASPAPPPSNFGAQQPPTNTPPSASSAPVDSTDDDSEDDDAAGFDASSAEFLSSAGPPPPPGETLVPAFLAIVGLLVGVAVLLAAFVLPASNSDPKHLPIGVAGTSATQAAVKKVLDQDFGSTTFDITGYSTKNDLTHAIEHREVYGGLVVSDSEGSVLYSTAASYEAAGKLVQFANSTQAQWQYDDVKPLPTKDPEGANFKAAGLPLALLSILAAVVLATVFRRKTFSQLGTSIVGSFVLGFGAAALLSFVLHATEGGNFWLSGIALSAGFLSVSLLLLGLNAIGGRIGMGIGIAVLVLVSLPLSAYTIAPQWLPEPWGGYGQFLPFGAAGALLRNAAFFDGGYFKPLIVLGVWALIGLLLLVLSGEAAEPVEDEPEVSTPEPQDPLVPTY